MANKAGSRSQRRRALPHVVAVLAAVVAGGVLLSTVDGSVPDRERGATTLQTEGRSAGVDESATITSGSAGTSHAWPSACAWSPDRSRMAFISSAGGISELHVMDSDGTDRIRVTEGDELVDGPAWSPDARFIAFSAYRAGNGEIYVVEADGGGRTRLTDQPGFDVQPAWSPGGERIAFTSGRDGTSAIYLMNRDGTSQARLTPNPGAYHPAWSPDGRWIAFDADAGDYNFSIHVINADGSGQAAVTDGSGVDVRPAWSVDGNVVIFTSDRNGGTETYSVALDDERLTPRQVSMNDGC